MKVVAAEIPEDAEEALIEILMMIADVDVQEIVRGSVEVVENVKVTEAVAEVAVRRSEEEVRNVKVIDADAGIHGSAVGTKMIIVRILIELSQQGEKKQA
ncbi:hypothetical protein OESDEN_24410 [Oesophagostomum dentatum]|uniref:Uncharacterized protein n=1 Tax=Oesophagostomum dentatum TaxID=61180 RepID=A0A0B1RWF7_OESDE|nr:hypothetical protein OESDEN_24410 [Oesophagostomum dentatum]